MIKEQAHPERITYYTHHLDHLREKIVAATRDPYLEKTLGERQALITKTMKDLIPATTFVDQFLEKQIGDASWEITEEDMANIPPHAVERLKKSFDDRSIALWPWLLFDKNNEQLRKDFMKNYFAAAQMSGSFPFAPTFENVAKQREVDWKHRLLAAQLIFAENCITTPDINAAAAPLLSMIGAALDSYKSQSVQDLQTMVKRKAPKLNDDNINQFIRFGMWNDPEDLAYMCVDRGLRDAVVNHYGVLRDARLPTASGYLVGQHVMAITPIAYRCLRVSN